MGSHGDEESLLEDALLQDEGSGLYTGDGSVDIQGKPVLKQNTGNWKACVFILGTECCERLAFYGIAMNLVTYLTKKLHQGNVSAATNSTIWRGSCYLTTLIGAFLADAYWGRYWTIAVFSIIYFVVIYIPFPLTSRSLNWLKLEWETSPLLMDCANLAKGGNSLADRVHGICTLTLSASVSALKPPECFGSECASATPAEYMVFFIGLYLMALGTGGIKPCVSSFGTSIYRFKKAGGSPLTRMCQVLVASRRKWNLEVPEDNSLLFETQDESSAIEGSRKLEHSDELRCLDKAAIITAAEMNNEDFYDPWRLCTVTQVEELKILIRFVPIWATGIIFAAVASNLSTMFLEQGMMMDTTIGSFTIPPASLATFDIISVIIWVPVYDRVIVPIARKFTGKERGISDLQRMGIGLFLSILSMSAAAVVEINRLQLAKELDLVEKEVAVPLSILWQIPQFFLFGAAEIFTFIGQLQFFYEQSPDAMRSLCSALPLLTNSLGNYLCSLVLTIVTYITTVGGKTGWIPDNINEGHLDYFFWLWAGLSFLNMFVYIACAKKYKQKKAS
ncbi:Peptide transporter [Morus notabilis]|uniref:Peptide transporter n=1 Tax=Morus notabilis TaxID=981085 RepID=W9S3A6_9ROSA|nr:Peptide transporter [Morus notabilis]